MIHLFVKCDLSFKYPLLRKFKVGGAILPLKSPRTLHIFLALRGHTSVSTKVPYVVRKPWLHLGQVTEHLLPISQLIQKIPLLNPQSVSLRCAVLST